MKIIVGSKNPVKVGAVREAFEKYFPECEVVGIDVESGVAAQPMSEEETIRGAKNRANNALGAADYGVGIEGGVEVIEGKLFECAWACVVNQEGKIGLAGGLYFEIPEKVAKKIKAGGELGPLMDEYMDERNLKQKMGAIGVLSQGKLDRKQAYVQIVLSAMIRFVSPEWFA